MSEVPLARTCHRAILVADIVSSTELYERLGDVAAKALVEPCLDLLRKATLAGGGHVVKHLGDGVLSAFEDEPSSVRAALEMCAQNAACGLPIRVGINAGMVLVEDGDVFGDAVNTAARIASLAKPMEILISGELEQALPADLRALARRVQPLTVKGKRQPLRLFAILNDRAGGEDAPLQTLCVGPAEVASSGRLELTYRGRRHVLSAEEELSIGRDADCALTVPSHSASRLHARIFGRRGRFVLADQSSNGTFLIPSGHSKLHLIREEAILYGSGSVFVGETPEDHGVEPIRYRVL